MDALRRDHLPGELEPILRTSGFDGTIAVQASQVVEETEWLLKLADDQDVIFEVLYPGPRHPVRSVADLQSVLSKLKTGDYISLNVHSLSQGAGDRVVNIRIGG